jgi:hypothetical protein
MVYPCITKTLRESCGGSLELEVGLINAQLHVSATSCFFFLKCAELELPIYCIHCGINLYACADVQLPQDLSWLLFLVRRDGARLRSAGCRPIRTWCGDVPKMNSLMPSNSTPRSLYYILPSLLFIPPFSSCHRLYITSINTFPTIIEQITSHAKKISDWLNPNLSLSLKFDNIARLLSYLVLAELSWHVKGSQQPSN